MTTIKQRRAQRLSSTGRYPATYLAISAHVPEAIVERLTARELASLIDAMDRCSKEGQRLASQAVIDEGAVWDHRHQQFRDLARP